MPSTVLLIGAASDMAVALANKFAAAGYHLQLAARTTGRIKTMQADLAIRYPVTCTAHELDITRFDSHTAFWQSLPVKPDITICVVGYMNDNEKVIIDQQETLTTINTNFTGPVSLLNIIGADYAAREHGVIVGISSVAGMRGRQSNYIYGSAKSGFTTYLSGLRNKLFHSKVHVMTVLPGFVNTKMTENLNLPKLLTAQPADVANAIFKGIKNKKNIIYIKWFWRWIMLIITSIPEFMFKKKKL